MSFPFPQQLEVTVYSYRDIERAADRSLGKHRPAMSAEMTTEAKPEPLVFRGGAFVPKDEKLAPKAAAPAKAVVVPVAKVEAPVVVTSPPPIVIAEPAPVAVEVIVSAPAQLLSFCKEEPRRFIPPQSSQPHIPFGDSLVRRDGRNAVSRRDKRMAKAARHTATKAELDRRQVVDLRRRQQEAAANETKAKKAS